MDRNTLDPTTTLAALTERAHAIVCSNLERYGNTLSPVHRATLHEMIEGFGLLALGMKQGRYAYPLGCGLGKTQSVVAFCAALHELGLDHQSVAVSASKVEALCDLKRSLLAQGVPLEKIGLLHGYTYDPLKVSKLRPTEPGHASEPRTSDVDNERSPFLLVTHNRVRGLGDVRRFPQYRGVPRDLLVWDESLLAADARSITLTSLQSSLGYLQPIARHEQPGLCDYLQEVIGMLSTEAERQRVTRDAAQPLGVPQLPLETFQQYKALLKQWDVWVLPLVDLLEMSLQPIRVIASPNRSDDGLVTYDIAVPQALTSIAILDASYPIRILEQLDKTIRPGLIIPTDLKRFDNVTVHHLRKPSGRGSTEKDFLSDRKISSEVCHLLSTQLKADEAAIIFTFKPSGQSRRGKSSTRHRIIDCGALLREDMRNAGLDPEQKLWVQQGEGAGRTLAEMPRWIFLTWGQETSLNEYAYARHVVFTGVLHRDRLDVASSYVAQSDDLFAPAGSKAIGEAIDSECAHSVYQALSRGACRHVNGDGQALEMHAWLMHSHERLRPALESVMPGLRWERWRGKYLVPEGPRGPLTADILRHLGGLPSEVTRLSVQQLKKDIDHNNVAAKTFQRALEDALLESTWLKENRSVVRIAEVLPLPATSALTRVTHSQGPQQLQWDL